MIKCEDGHCHIKGRVIDIVYDLALILSEIRENEGEKQIDIAFAISKSDAFLSHKRKAS